MYQAPETIKIELQRCRAEEAEALHRANHLRSMGADYADLKDAMREAEQCHAKVNALQRQLREVTYH